jgi:hypothetical protein
MTTVSANRVLAVACLAAFIGGGCGGENNGGMPTTPVASESTITGTAATPSSLIGMPQGRTLELPAGPSTATFTITALPPPEHTWDVHVNAPATADIAVRVRTWYGQSLRVLDTTHDPTSCDMQGARSVCSLAFPRLEAQRPGEWTVIVTKRSELQARVRVKVIFNRD